MYGCKCVYVCLCAIHIHFFIHSNISSSLKCVYVHVCVQACTHASVRMMYYGSCAAHKQMRYIILISSHPSAVWWVMMKFCWVGRTDLCDCQDRYPAPLRQNTDTPSKRRRTTCYPYPSNPQEEVKNLMFLYVIELYFIYIYFILKFITILKFTICMLMVKWRIAYLKWWIYCYFLC